jgi:hypothetical protein
MSDAPSPNPTQSAKSVKAFGCAALILLIVSVAWLAEDAGCNSTPSNPGATAKPSKAEWRQKVRPYWNPGGPIKVATIADFKALVGEPSHTETVEGVAYWSFECSDGIIQVELINPNMSGGRMLIKDIKDF